VNRPDGLGLTGVLMNADLGAGRYRSLHLLDLRRQERLTLAGAYATLNLDVFNALNTSTTLRQFSEATATSFRSPLEIVRLGCFDRAADPVLGSAVSPCQARWRAARIARTSSSGMTGGRSSSGEEPNAARLSRIVAL